MVDLLVGWLVDWFDRAITPVVSSQLYTSEMRVLSQEITWDLRWKKCTGAGFSCITWLPLSFVILPMLCIHFICLSGKETVDLYDLLNYRKEILKINIFKKLMIRH